MSTPIRNHNLNKDILLFSNNPPHHFHEEVQCLSHDKLGKLHSLSFFFSSTLNGSTSQFKMNAISIYRLADGLIIDPFSSFGRKPDGNKYLFTLFIRFKLYDASVPPNDLFGQSQN